MGIVVRPTLSTSNDRKPGNVTINFTYDFTGDTAVPVSVGGYPALVGSKFTLDVGSIQNVTNISAIRALQVTIDFNSFTQPSGPLFIVSQSTSQVICLANHLTPTAGIRNMQMVSAIVPIVSAAPSKIDFIKVSDQNVNAMSGVIWVTAFNFDMPVYTAMSQG